MTRLMAFCAALAGLATGAAAQTVTSPAFVALSVADLEASAAWYRDAFDLTVTRLPQTSPVRVALLQGASLIVELVEHPDAVDLKSRAPDVGQRFLVHGPFKVGFFVENLDAMVERLTARGVVFRGPAFTDPVLRARSILLLDNSGNTIQLFERV